MHFLPNEPICGRPRRTGRCLNAVLCQRNRAPAVLPCAIPFNPMNARPPLPRRRKRDRTPLMKRTLLVLAASLLAPLAAPCADESPSAKILPSDWNAEDAAGKAMQGLINVSAPEVKGAHDAEFVMLGDRAYVVSEANEVQAGESPEWPFIYATMSVVNVTTMSVEKIIPVAKSEPA